MLFKYLKKMGGISLLLRYMQNRVFIYAVLLFTVLPKNRFGLEVLSECIENRIYEKLKRKYKTFCNSSEQIIFDINDREKIVWFAWMQGIENAPQIVNINKKRIEKYFFGYEIKVITVKNFRNFTNIPKGIIKKWEKGVITHTHFSDILRTNLLINHGGIWVDATVYLSNTVPDDILLAPFFLFRSLKPGKIGKRITISSWFISSCKSFPILVDVQKMLFHYWKNNNSLKDYFLFHLFLEIAMENYPNLVDLIPKYSNEPPHILQYELFKTYIPDVYENTLSKSFAHKLTVKCSEEDMKKEGTVFQYILLDR